MALVDGDPYGIDILSVYKYGSRALSHENSKLAASRLKWLGVWSTELSRFVHIPAHKGFVSLLTRTCSLGIDKDALIPITTQDEKKVRSVSSLDSGFHCFTSTAGLVAPAEQNALKVEVCGCPNITMTSFLLFF